MHDFFEYLQGCCVSDQSQMITYEVHREKFFGRFCVQVFKFTHPLLTNSMLSEIIRLEVNDMKKICLLLCLLLSMAMFNGCSEVAAQVETVAQQVDIEAILTGVIESIDWEELKKYAQEGYDALTEQFPALKGENVKAFLKENGLDLLNKYIESSDEAMQENARKLGEIIKILNPELSDEVDSIITN